MVRKLISIFIATLFAFTASAAFATGGGNPPDNRPPSNRPPEHKPAPTPPPPAPSVDVDQKVTVGVGVSTHTSADAKASAGATSGSYSSATGGNASATGGHSSATVGNVSGGHSSASTGPVTATGGQGGAGGNVGDINAGSGNGNSVNIGGTVFPRQNPGAIATAPAATTCVGAGTSVALSTPVVSFAINTASDRERCNAIVEAERCIAQAVFIRNSTGICKSVAKPLGACFANMPPVQDAAKSLGFEPRAFADDMAAEVLSECDASDRLAKQRAEAERTASANAVAQAKARADQLAAELAAARDANDRLGQLLRDEQSRKPAVVYRDRPKPATSAGRVRLNLEVDCAEKCPPKQQ